MVNKEWRMQRKERVCMAGEKKVGKVETSKEEKQQRWRKTVGGKNRICKERK